MVGDVREVLDSLPDDSVDLILTSSPFLSVRSYLPPSDPLKPYELGSEPTPGAFIDHLLDVVERCRRVLASHGSLVWELGDTATNSGGAGGDYDKGGLRDGQPRFSGSADRQRGTNGVDERRDESQATVGTRSNARFRAGYLRNDGRKTAQVANYDIEYPAPIRAKGGWPQDKSLALVPELFRLSLAYGFNPLTGRETERWRVRNIVRWFRPNPPVGALSDSFRNATSDWVVACTGRQRYFDLDAARTAAAREYSGLHKGGLYDVRGNPNWRDKGASDFGANPAGAPPLDWWDDEPDEVELDDLWRDGAGFIQSTRGYKGSHYAVFSQAVVLRFLEVMCPRQVCWECGKPSERVTRRGYIGTPDDSTRVKMASEYRLSGVDNPPENGWERESNTLGWSSCACGGASPTSWNLATRKEWRAAGKSTDWSAVYIGTQFVGLVAPQAGHWVDCGGPLASWRHGLVLDPFTGTGTVLAVAHGHGRDSIGIDLDSRNVELARGRLGMFLEVEDRTPGKVQAP